MDQQYTRRLEKIEQELNRWLPGEQLAVGNEQGTAFSWAEKVFAGSASPYHGILTGPCRDLLMRGGKRWRPLLMALVCETLGGGDAAVPLAPLVEFCHNASLIHDDIEDSSDERRGKPAVHLIYGIDAAINSGSFLYFLPLACIESWAEQRDAGMAAGIYALWGKYMRKLHLGQAMDIHWHRNPGAIPTVDEYLAMCALKTGCLARFAAELGAAVAGIAGNRPSGMIPLRNFGEAAEKLGIGFQILDDVKNLTTGLPGKKRGDDIVEGKKSLPVLLYLHRDPEKIKMVSRCFSAAGSGGVNVPEVEELIQLLLAGGTIAEAEKRGRNLIAEAGAVFSAAGPLLAGFTGLIA